MLPFHRARHTGSTIASSAGYDDDKYHKGPGGGGIIHAMRSSITHPLARVFLVIVAIIFLCSYVFRETPADGPLISSKDELEMHIPEGKAIAEEDNAFELPPEISRIWSGTDKDYGIDNGLKDGVKGGLQEQIANEEFSDQDYNIEKEKKPWISQASGKLKDKENNHYKPIIKEGIKNKSSLDQAAKPSSPPSTHEFPTNYLFHQNPLPKTLKTSTHPWAERQAAVIKAFKHAWKGYTRDAWGMDEYHPRSHAGSNWNPQGSGLGLTIVDALDTILLMNLTEEYAQAREWIKSTLDFNQSAQVNIFETTIRVLGGLLSAYHLSGNDEIYLEKAIDLAERLLPGFNTNSGFALSDINLQGGGDGDPWNGWGTPASTAETTTLQLEFKYLAHLTGRREFWDVVEKIMINMRKLELKGETFDGLVPIYISVSSGEFSSYEIRLGSRGDSYYEYLLKQYLQTSNTEPYYLDMYNRAIKGVKNHLLSYSYPSNLLFIGELLNYKYTADRIHNKMDHLVCFMGGNLALGATGGQRMEYVDKWEVHEIDDLKIGKELTKTCWEMYHRTATGLAPEIVYFSTLDTDGHRNEENMANDIIIKPSDAHSLLRPETVESLFLMWRITGDVKYREWGWSIFQSFEKHAKVEEGGYTNLEDVRSIPAVMRDKMETFFLAETLKYLYLLFSPDDIIPLDKYVFNTEAHPLPKFVPKWKPASFWEGNSEKHDSNKEQNDPQAAQMENEEWHEQGGIHRNKLDEYDENFDIELTEDIDALDMK